MKNTPEFSRPIAIEGIIPDKLRQDNIEATVEECAALARRFDLRELSNFKAKIGVRRISGGAAVKVEGAFEADVIQACGVSLRDVSSRVEGRFETFFTEEDASDGEGDLEFILGEDEAAAEILSGGMIDLGEIAAQYLSLELDPYPRAPGVSLAAQMAEVGEEVKNQPFLKVLQQTKSDEKKKK